jgi:hypothetical protein
MFLKKLKKVGFLIFINSDYYFIINRRKPTMKNLQIKKTYSINGVDYDTKEEAIRASQIEVLNTEISKGVQNVIDKAPEIIRALRIVSQPK